MHRFLKQTNQGFEYMPYGIFPYPPIELDKDSIFFLPRPITPEKDLITGKPLAERIESRAPPAYVEQEKMVKFLDNLQKIWDAVLRGENIDALVEELFEPDLARYVDSTATMIMDNPQWLRMPISGVLNPYSITSILMPLKVRGDVRAVEDGASKYREKLNEMNIASDIVEKIMEYLYKRLGLTEQGDDSTIPDEFFLLLYQSVPGFLLRLPLSSQERHVILPSLLNKQILVASILEGIVAAHTLGLDILLLQRAIIDRSLRGRYEQEGSLLMPFDDDSLYSFKLEFSFYTKATPYGFMIFNPTDKSILSLASILLHESIHLAIDNIRNYREQHGLQSFELDNKEYESFLEEVFVETLTVLLVAEGDISRARNFLRHHVGDYTAGVKVLLDKLELLLELSTLDCQSNSFYCNDALCIMLKALNFAKDFNNIKTPWGCIYTLYDNVVGDDLYEEILRQRHTGFVPNEGVQALSKDTVGALVKSHIKVLNDIRRRLNN